MRNRNETSATWKLRLAAKRAKGEVKKAERKTTDQVVATEDKILGALDEVKTKLDE